MSTFVLKSMIIKSVCACAILSLLPSSTFADQVDDLVSRSKSRITAGAASQKRIDDLSEKAEKLRNEAQKELKSAETLKAFNAKLRRTAVAQREAIAKLEGSIEGASLIERQIVPMMQRMIDGLEKFIEIDLPFKLDERRDRVERIKSYLTNANITAAERFRQVLAAYSAETAYGDSIAVYTEELALPAGQLTVNILQIGRTGLYYQTLDGAKSGYWDKQSKAWVELDSGYSEGINQAIRITQGKESKNLMRLPITAPEAI